jgi:hypothetical protein
MVSVEVWAVGPEITTGFGANEHEGAGVAVGVIALQERVTLPV